MSQVYAMLQQRDNELNHRYAADMRVITAITLVFLPATFIATLFSTSFWDFGPANTGQKVSSWVWLYFVLTLGLTLIVLSIWRGFTVIERSKTLIMDLWTKSVVMKRLRRDKKAGDEEKAEKSA